MAETKNNSFVEKSGLARDPIEVLGKGVTRVLGLTIYKYKEKESKIITSSK